MNEKDFIVTYPTIKRGTIAGYECCHGNTLTHFIGNIAIAIRNSVFTGYLDTNTPSTIFTVIGQIGSRGRGMTKYFNKCRYPSTKSEANRLIAMQVQMMLKRAYSLTSSVDVQNVSMHIVFTGKETGEVWIAFNDNPNLSGFNRAVLIDASGSDKILDTFDFKPLVNPDDKEEEEG